MSVRSITGWDMKLDPTYIEVSQSITGIIKPHRVSLGGDASTSEPGGVFPFQDKKSVSTRYFSTATLCIPVSIFNKFCNPPKCTKQFSKYA